MLQEAVQAQDLSVVSCDVKLNYDYWSYRESLIPRRCREEKKNFT